MIEALVIGSVAVGLIVWANISTRRATARMTPEERAEEERYVREQRQAW